MKFLATEKLGLPLAGDTPSLLSLSSSGFLYLHRFLLCVLEDLNAFEITRQVNKVEMRSIELWMQNNSVTSKFKTAN